MNIKQNQVKILGEKEMLNGRMMLPGCVASFPLLSPQLHLPSPAIPEQLAGQREPAWSFSQLIRLRHSDTSSLIGVR